MNKNTLESRNQKYIESICPTKGTHQLMYLTLYGIYKITNDVFSNDFNWFSCENVTNTLITSEQLHQILNRRTMSVRGNMTIQRKQAIKDLAEAFKPFHSKYIFINFFKDGTWNINQSQRCLLRRKLSELVDHWDGNDIPESINHNLRNIEQLILEIG